VTDSENKFLGQDHNKIQFVVSVSRPNTPN